MVTCDRTRMIRYLRSEATVQIIETIGIWFTGIVAILLAVYGEALRRRRYHPNLVIEIPERYPHKTFFGTAPGDIDVYYVHVMIRNTGNERADGVEVLVERIEALHQDGSFKPVGIENPNNLPVSLGGGAISRTIHKNLFAYFDVGHITDPSMRGKLNSRESKPDIPDSEASLVMEYQIRPKTGDHILRKGTYRLSIVAAPQNGEPRRCVLELNFTGQWATSELDMRRDGIGMNIV